MAIQVKQVSEPVIPRDIEKQLMTVEMLSIKDLIVDHKFQRDRDSARIAKMAKEWNWNACGSLAVSLRKHGRLNVYSVLDGQQRMGAIAAQGFTKAPCRVYVDLTETQEAELFELLNHSKQPTFNDLFKSRLSRGEEHAKNIESAVKGVGWALDPDRRHTAPIYIQTMLELERIYKMGGSLLLMDTLRFLNDIWGGEHLSQQQMIISGISLFLHRYSNAQGLSMPELKDRLRKAGQVKMIQRALQYAAARGKSTGARSIAFCEAMLMLYNQGRKEAYRIPSVQI